MKQALRQATVLITAAAIAYSSALQDAHAQPQAPPPDEATRERGASWTEDENPAEQGPVPEPSTAAPEPARPPAPPTPAPSPPAPAGRQPPGNGPGQAYPPYPPPYPPAYGPPQQYPQYPPYPPPYPTPYPPQPYPPQRISVTPNARAEHEAREQDDRERPRRSTKQRAYFRFGFNAVGGGTLAFKGECSGPCTFSVKNADADAVDHTRVLLGLDTMFGGGPVTIGFGFWFLPRVSLEQNDVATFASDDQHLGWEFAVPIMVGAAVPVSKDVSVTLRGLVGPQVLFGSGGALGRDSDAFETSCSRLGARSCDTSAETRLGWTPGFASGAQFELGAGGLATTELMLQYTNMELFSVDVEGSGWKARQSYEYEGLRLWLLLGIGFGDTR